MTSRKVGNVSEQRRFSTFFMKKCKVIRERYVRLRERVTRLIRCSILHGAGAHHARTVRRILLGDAVSVCQDGVPRRVDERPAQRWSYIDEYGNFAVDSIVYSESVSESVPGALDPAGVGRAIRSDGLPRFSITVVVSIERILVNWVLSFN
jgi:hypothetical protein